MTWSPADKLWLQEASGFLTFSDVDEAGGPLTGVPALSWGSSEIGGIYRETITGLHRDTLKIKGTFLLRKVSEIGSLEVAQ